MVGEHPGEVAVLRVRAGGMMYHLIAASRASMFRGLYIPS